MRDSGDFDAFYAATFRSVVGQVFAMTGDLQDAEDAVAEAYARAWQRWPKIQAYEDPKAWVRTVAYRVAVSSWRRAVGRWKAHRRHGPPADAPGATPDQLALRDALKLIPREQCRAVVLHHLVGLSVAEIAAETHVPEGTVKTRLARGRKALARHVDEFADDTDTATEPASDVVTTNRGGRHG
ncbi:MAG: SigE family RNA polymerase sigma factor [Streptomycetaceae bacterium]|nr:SigE family RNA polymerase sigma factor [Streptomycetaceae bacterium]